MKRAASDPMEAGFADACLAHGIEAIPHDHISGLDFYLPAYDVYVEVKQFHSPRISEQMSRQKNVIAIQGMGALAAFAQLLKANRS